jgi:5-formyltetrahydrofolate cyclo-ligase
MRRIRAAIADRVERSLRLCAAAVAECDRLGSGLAVLAFCGAGGEPDTGPLIKALHVAGHTVHLPRVEGEVMVAVRVEPSEALQPGAFGIPSPSGPAVDPGTIHLVFVPGLAFTADGRRLGQGGGFYDRFLPLLRDDCVTIGVGFTEQLVEALPIEPHDSILDRILTA